VVLPGGAARGAYEAGVLCYLLEHVTRELGRPPRLSIISGTSIGAFNGCLTAAWADDPLEAAARLERAWTALRVSDVLHPDALRWLAIICGLTGLGRGRPGCAPGLVGNQRLYDLIGAAIPFDRMARLIRDGVIDAVTVSSTHVASGRTVVFVEGRGVQETDVRDGGVLVPAQLSVEHLLASSAIPLLFPPVLVQGELYCEGGLRQNVPLAPALRLGAERLLVVTAHTSGGWPKAAVAAAHESAYGSPLFLLGKLLNALLLDRVNADIGRLEQLNGVLAATGSVAGLRHVPTVVVRSSRDIGAMAGEFVASREFAGPARGLVERVMRALGEHLAGTEADLLSYLLFDGRFAARLIELGRLDARSRHAELCALFA
jgi:NTE family protein